MRGLALFILRELVITLPNDSAVPIIGMPNFRSVPTAAIPAFYLAGEYTDGTQPIFACRA